VRREDEPPAIAIAAGPFFANRIESIQERGNSPLMFKVWAAGPVEVGGNGLDPLLDWIVRVAAVHHVLEEGLLHGQSELGCHFAVAGRRDVREETREYPLIVLRQNS
jgi:hypothetical protein